jgi:hypothetical protein
MKIKILYSHLNVTGTDSKVRPQWFDFEKCFKNLLKTISYTPNGLSKQSDIEIHVIYDVTRGGLANNWIWKYFNEGKNNIIFHQIEGGTMEKAAIGMYELAKGLSFHMDDEDIFYFLENDYLHSPGWITKVKTLFNEFNGLNYVSLYDHNDKYFLPQYNDLVSKIIVTPDHHWRTTPSTCGSYLCTKKTFLEDYDTHTKIMGDHNKWVYLQEQKGRFVLSPIPGLSTHVMTGLMSPAIDWEEINKG